MSKAADYLRHLLNKYEKQFERWLKTSPESADYQLETLRYAESRAAYVAAKKILEFVVEDFTHEKQ